MTWRDWAGWGSWASLFLGVSTATVLLVIFGSGFWSAFPIIPGVIGQIVLLHLSVDPMETEIRNAMRPRYRDD